MNRLKETEEEVQEEEVGILVDGNGVCSALQQYYFVNKSLPWSEAQSHCRKYGGELATVDGPEYQQGLVEVARKYNSSVWIGLYDDAESWTWSLAENGNYSGREVEPWSWPWRSNEPNNYKGRQGCVKIVNETWDDEDCNEDNNFLCFDNKTNDTTISDSRIVSIKIKMSWWDAQSYCREHHTDLPSIRNLEENRLMSQMHATAWKWIGLHRNLWGVWSDGSNSSYRNWRAGMPNNTAKTLNNCALVLAYSGWQWGDLHCNSKFNFICNAVPVLKQWFRIKFSSADIDPNDPELSKAILKQLHEKLKEKMVNEDFSLTWMKGPDGEIFHNTHKDKKQQYPEFADERCNLKIK
ncbi:unnamed protein product [Lota lota]